MSEPGRWEAAASGLELHRNALIMRVVVIVASILFMATQLMSKNPPDGFGGIAMLLVLAQVVATLLALIGIARFSVALPRRGGELISFAVLCLVGVLAIQLYETWITWRVMQAVSDAKHGSFPSQALIDKAESLPTLDIVASIAGLVAVLVILGTIASIGRELSAPGLTRRAGSLIVAVVALGIGYGVIMHWALHARTGDSAIGLLAVLAIGGIAVLVSYLNLLGRAVYVMRSRGNQIPPAHVVGG